MMDVARACGLSRPTVNLVLSGKGHLLRPETVSRVLAAAAEVGYRANTAARAMRLGRHSTVALLSSAAPGMSGIPLDTLNALHDRLATGGFRLLFSRLADDSFTEPGRLPAVATEHCADAVILNRILPADDPVAEALEADRIPAVWFNIEREHDTVRPDDEGAGRGATERFIALGHRRIAYLNGLHTSHVSEPDRRRGYLAAMKSARLPADARFAPDPSTSLAGPGCDLITYYQRWFASPERPTALVLNEQYNVEPVRIACAVLGLRIPQDLALLVLCGQTASELAGRTSQLRTPDSALGTALAEMVLERLERPTEHLPTRRLPFVVREGDSLAPPPARG
jgi:LacI family transcriptional regulator